MMYLCIWWAINHNIGSEKFRISCEFDIKNSLSKEKHVLPTKLIHHDNFEVWYPICVRLFIIKYKTCAIWNFLDKSFDKKIEPERCID